MGAARRRKLAGTMPDQTPKPRKTARKKVEPEEMIMGISGMGFYGGYMDQLLDRRSCGELFAIRSEMVRMNREQEELYHVQTTN